jgi:tetratricopeptide (TPR) repeat protein
MKHKHQRTSSKKKKSKKGQLAPPNKVPSFDELVEAGDAAAASMEGDKALALYASAESLLRKEQAATSNNLQTPVHEKLVYVLEKLGEIKVSLGDLEGARKDFENAINLLTSFPEEKNPQYHETLAGLYLYIGQLSSEQGALEAHRKGIQSLELCVNLRGNACSTSVQDAASMDVENGEQKEANTALNNARYVPDS